MKICKMVIVPIAGAMLSAAFVSAQDSQDRAQRAGHNQQGQNQAEQNPNQPGQRTGQQVGRTSPVGDQAQRQNPDHIMAACVAIDNQEEVALATMLRDKLQHDEVKQFAAMMIRDHQNYLTSLEKFAPGIATEQLDHSGTAGQAQGNNKRTGVEQARGEASANASGVRRTSGTDQDRDNQDRDNQDRDNQDRDNQDRDNQDRKKRNRQTTTGDRDSQNQNARNLSGSPLSQGGQPDQIQIQREIAQECLRATREDMQNKQGADADKAFIGAQIIKHGAMKAKLTVLQRHASSELAQVFAQGLETTEKHKQQAEQIMKKLDSAEGGAERRTQPEAQRQNN